MCYREYIDPHWVLDDDMDQFFSFWPDIIESLNQYIDSDRCVVTPLVLSFFNA